ncbi:hypothetical protein EGW03_06615 [bacterium]|jgi:uncharacterized protein YcfL|nr:hypothetical protein [bacterium]OKZ80389.1 MAG: hypothetical protein BHW07_03655 [Clostridium sp. CAG_433_25_7]
MKKIGYVFMITMICFLFIGCGKNQSNIQEPLSDVMKKLYENISEDEMPLLETVEVTKENQEYYLGNVSFNYQEALASEPVMSSIAHSVVLIRLKDTKNIESIKKEIKEKVDPNKWICVGVEDKNVIVVSKGNLILLVMDDEYATQIRDNFLNL